MFYGLGTNEAWIADRVNLFIAIAPIVYFQHSSQGEQLIKRYTTSLWHDQGAKGVWYMFGKSDWLENSIQGKILESLLKFITGLLGDFPGPLDDAKWFKVMNSWFPAKASTKELSHYMQLIHNGVDGKGHLFNKFDYLDAAVNQQKYGQPTPPVVDLTKISKVPIGMFVGKKDPLGDPQDTQFLRDQLKNVVHYEELADFDHSFFYHMDMSYVKEAIALADQYKPKTGWFGH